MDMGGYMGWGGMFFGPLAMIAVLGVLIAVIVMLVRGFTGGSSSAPGQPGTRDPLDILKARFASGEIDRREYEEKRRLLEG